MPKNIWKLAVLIFAILMVFGCGGGGGGGGGDNSSCGQIVDGEGTPAIKFTHVPPWGTFEKLKGRVSHVASSQYQVVVYINVRGGWWVKPYWDEPTTPIKCDGTWTADITTGGVDEEATIIVAYLIPITYSPPLDYYPDKLDNNSVAKVVAYR